jgi:hypothetical protein
MEVGKYITWNVKGYGVFAKKVKVEVHAMDELPKGYRWNWNQNHGAFPQLWQKANRSTREALQVAIDLENNNGLHSITVGIPFEVLVSNFIESSIKWGDPQERDFKHIKKATNALRKAADKIDREAGKAFRAFLSRKGKQS